jgi:hypothetical protein
MQAMHGMASHFVTVHGSLSFPRMRKSRIPGLSGYPVKPDNGRTMTLIYTVNPKTP